jgi:predicted SAM-dependent methyltransferase
MDIGCGQEIVKLGAFGVDARPFHHTSFVTDTLYDLPVSLKSMVGLLDCVFSSHTLEHLPDDDRALREWSKFLKPGGYLVLYLPDDDYYDNSSNPEHLQVYRYQDFVDKFGCQYDDLKLVEHGLDVGPSRYSFYVVFQKMM